VTAITPYSGLVILEDSGRFGARAITDFVREAPA